MHISQTTNLSGTKGSWHVSAAVSPGSVEIRLGQHGTGKRQDGLRPAALFLMDLEGLTDLRVLLDKLAQAIPVT